MTRRVLAHVARTAPDQAQIAIAGFPPASRRQRYTARVTLGDRTYHLIVGDTSAVWRAHQREDKQDDFEALFASLSDTPDRWEHVHVEGDQ